MNEFQAQTNHVHERTKDIVHGFIHQQSLETLNTHTVPDLVLTLCVLFYNSRDHFVSCSSKMRISRSKCGTYTELMHQGMNWSTAIGNTCIDLESQPHRWIYEWIIRTNATNIFIGIESTPNISKRVDTHLDHNVFNVYNPHKYYAWCSLPDSSSLLVSNDMNSKMTPNFRHGIRGTIKMIVDVRHGCIRFVRDGQELGLAFSNIDLTQKYHLAISLYKKGGCVQLMDNYIQHY